MILEGFLSIGKIIVDADMREKKEEVSVTPVIRRGLVFHLRLSENDIGLTDDAMTRLDTAHHRHDGIVGKTEDKNEKKLVMSQ